MIAWNRFLLTKGNPAAPDRAPPDVMDWKYSGNKLHPTEKAVQTLRSLIEAFSKPDDTVLDPFCGSGSTLKAAREPHPRYAGIELHNAHIAPVFSLRY
jgi:adenine-specific DNA-methyltransferase